MNSEVKVWKISIYSGSNFKIITKKGTYDEMTKYVDRYPKSHIIEINEA